MFVLIVDNNQLEDDLRTYSEQQRCKCVQIDTQYNGTQLSYHDDTQRQSLN
jgi:hypothetical protein